MLTKIELLHWEQLMIPSMQQNFNSLQNSQMTKASSLTYYPRFVLTCSDGQCLATADLDYLLKYVRDAEDNYGGDITQFVPGQILKISWAGVDNEVDVRSYKVDRVEVHQIKSDLDMPTTGDMSDNCRETFGKEKQHMMEVYVFLNAV